MEQTALLLSTEQLKTLRASTAVLKEPAILEHIDRALSGSNEGAVEPLKRATPSVTSFKRKGIAPAVRHYYALSDEELSLLVEGAMTMLDEIRNELKECGAISPKTEAKQRAIKRTIRTLAHYRDFSSWNELMALVPELAENE